MKALLLVVLLCCPLMAQQGVRVARVIDGDSFEADDGRIFLLQGIDAPSRLADHGEDAKRLLEVAILGRTVQLNRIEASPAATNQYYAFVSWRNMDINGFMLRQGLAKQDPSRLRLKSWAKLTQDAQNERRGIWTNLEPPQVQPPARAVYESPAPAPIRQKPAPMNLRYYTIPQSTSGDYCPPGST